MWSGCEGALCGVGVRVPYGGVGMRGPYGVRVPYVEWV